MIIWLIPVLFLVLVIVLLGLDALARAWIARHAHSLKPEPWYVRLWRLGE